jgi:hypothetical protein
MPLETMRQALRWHRRITVATIVGVPHRAPFTAARSAQRIEATPENGHEVLI